LMSQNRQEDRDRQRSKNDYEINMKAEKEIKQEVNDAEAEGVTTFDIIRYLRRLILSLSVKYNYSIIRCLFCSWSNRHN